MSLVSCSLISLYVTCIGVFPLVYHPFTQCLLLVVSSLSGLTFCYLCIGFSWYCLIPALIYLGGFYILMIFVSMNQPNSENSLGFSVWGVLILWCCLFSLIWSQDLTVGLSLDYANSLCSSWESPTYCFLGFLLILGFSLMSLVSSDKASFYR